MAQKHSTVVGRDTKSNFVTSKDGTRINYLSTGSGPLVVVIPGALSIASEYLAFAQALGGNYTVHIIERRGRGLSGPQGDDYSIVTESEDLLALLQETGAAFLVGHSYGGLVALETARNNPALTRIALYEPGVSINGLIQMDWMPAYEKYLSAKKYSDAFAEFVIGAGPDRARKTPHWLMKLILTFAISAHGRKVILSLLVENLREHQEVARLDNSYSNYRAVSANVLLMYGGKTGMKWIDVSMDKLAQVLPLSTVKAFPTLDHFAIDRKAPRDIAEIVSAFFAGYEQ